jgi:hypothetical protein
MELLTVARVALATGGVVLAGVEDAVARRTNGRLRPARAALAAWAAGSLVFLAFLTVNHLSSPASDSVLDGPVLQHFWRALAGEPVYPDPSPEYIPLAYNPLYYFLAVPFAPVFGRGLFTLRLVSSLAMWGGVVSLFEVVRRRTSSAWWGLMAAGLFAASYRAMDSNLDSAHPDSSLLFAVLLGTILVAWGRSSAIDVLAAVVLVAAFWLKQHGALFAVAGLAFMAWRRGPRRAIVPVAVALLLGPVAYLWAGPGLFGPGFHYFTREVPGRWMEPTVETVARYASHLAVHYGPLVLAGAFSVWRAVRTGTFGVWHAQLAAAALSGLLGALDPGSSDNVFIPVAAWTVLMGTLGLSELAEASPRARRTGAHLAVLWLSFALLLYRPRGVVGSWRADESQRDLVSLLRGLPGTVYAPTLGQLPEGYVLYPAAHWVTLEDLIRGPGVDTRNHPNTRRLLAPAISPAGQAFVLANFPLRTYPWIAFLEDYYVLDVDLEDRFEPLKMKETRWDAGWPRYLYRYAPEEASRRRRASGP